MKAASRLIFALLVFLSSPTAVFAQTPATTVIGNWCVQTKHGATVELATGKDWGAAPFTLKFTIDQGSAFPGEERYSGTLPAYSNSFVSIIRYGLGTGGQERADVLLFFDHPAGHYVIRMHLGTFDGQKGSGSLTGEIYRLAPPQIQTHDLVALVDINKGDHCGHSRGRDE